MSVARRLFIASALGLAFLGSKAFAEEKSPLGEFLSNVKDKAMKDFMERHDKDGRWDGKYYYDRENNKRYTRDEWRKELEWRYKEEKAGRDWRKERYGKGPREMDENKKRKDRDEKKRPPKPKKDKKPPRPKKDHRPDRREKDRR